MHLFIQAVMIPPEMLRVVVTLEVRRSGKVIKGFQVQYYRILQYRHSDIPFTVNLDVADLLSGQPYLSEHFVVQGIAKCLYELSSHREGVLDVVAVSCEAVLGKPVIGDVVCNENLRSHRYIFVKALKQAYGKGVPQIEVVCLVVYRILSCEISRYAVSVLIKILWRLICYVCVPVVIELQIMDKARHRHIFLLGP